MADESFATHTVQMCCKILHAYIFIHLANSIIPLTVSLRVMEFFCFMYCGIPEGKRLNSYSAPEVSQIICFELYLLKQRLAPVLSHPPPNYSGHSVNQIGQDSLASLCNHHKSGVCADPLSLDFCEDETGTSADVFHC